MTIKEIIMRKGETVEIKIGNDWETGIIVDAQHGMFSVLCLDGQTRQRRCSNKGISWREG